MIDEVHVISLLRRPERLRAFLDQRALSCIWPLPAPQHFVAMDGQRIVDMGGHLPMLWSSPGAYGCWVSHLTILTGALQRGAESVMIFEDDAVLDDDFISQLQDLMKKAPTWEALSLGGEHLRRPVPIHGVLRVRMAVRTHAYIVRGAAMRQLADVLARFHGAYPHDWEQAMTLQWFRWYAPQQWMVGQAEGFSDIMGKHEPYREW